MINQAQHLFAVGLLAAPAMINAPAATPVMRHNEEALRASIKERPAAQGLSPSSMIDQRVLEAAKGLDHLLQRARLREISRTDIRKDLDITWAKPDSTSVVAEAVVERVGQITPTIDSDFVIEV